ncbi:GspE/PulE family protein, partial [Jatrophihabitans endophyticus]|uniref:GspE/PulE family protein n=1 Tax=Jatrophihabitans endophyticus TaxID=1206085 RepID=UPI0019E04C11
MLSTTEGPILDALRTQGVSAKVLFQALSTAEDSGRPLRDVLVDEGLVTELELAEALALAYGLKCVDLLSYAVDAAATAKIPVALARRHRVLGISLDNDEIVVAVSDPGDVLALDDVRAATGLRVQPVVVPRDELSKAMERLQRAENDLDDVAASLGLESGPAAKNALDSVGDEAPIVRYVNSLIERAIDHRASDLHIEPAEGDVRIRFRIDGVLHDMDVVPRSIQSALISRLKIMAAVDITERRVPQNGRITVELNHRSVDLRLATLPT